MTELESLEYQLEVLSRVYHENDDRLNAKIKEQASQLLSHEKVIHTLNENLSVMIKKLRGYTRVPLN